MEKKMYKECPKTYKLLCRFDDDEAVEAAIEQLKVDHPEVFILDDLYEPCCDVFLIKFCLYVRKDTGGAYTLADDLARGRGQIKGKKVFDEVVLRISADRFLLFGKKKNGSLVELTGDRRRFVVESMKASDPEFVERVYMDQKNMRQKMLEKKRNDPCSLGSIMRELEKAHEEDMKIQEFLEREGFEE